MTLVETLGRKARLMAGAGLAFAGLLAAGSAAQAQDTIDYSAIEASPAIWHYGDEDSDVYVFGTFHILPPGLDWRTPEFNAILAEIDTLYLEADVLSQEAQMRVQALIPQYGLNPQGVTLSSLLDADTNAKLAEIAPTVGMSAAGLEPMQPWLAQIVLAVGQMQALGFNPNAGVETALTAELAESDVERGYFETAEQQIRFFADLPTDVQVAAFSEGLDQMERLPEEIDNMVRAWATGDMETLDSLVNEDMREQSPEIYEAIIVNRNAAWIPEMEAILEREGVTLVAVGAGHLPGERGVIQLLRDAGHTVERQ